MQRVILACGLLLCLTLSTLRAEAPVVVAGKTVATMMKYSRDDIIQKISNTASAYNIDPETALANAEVESNFNPNVSLYEPKFNTYSIGLFQMFLPTARAYGFKGTLQKLKDPHTNIRLGLMHLNKCVTRFGQDVKKIACCHNAGIAVKEKVCVNNQGVINYTRKVVDSYNRWKIRSNMYPVVQL